MALRPRTWGELRVAGALAEDATIADDAPVTRLLTAAGVVSSRVLKNPEAPACARGVAPAIAASHGPAGAA